MTPKTSKLISLLCAAAALISAGAGPASAFELKVPKTMPRQVRAQAPEYTPDVLLVMPNSDLDKEELDEIMQESHCQLVATLGQGDLTCLVIKTEKGKLEETEKRFNKDKKNFSTICRNYKIPCAATVPSDYTATGQWHLSAMRCTRAWDHATGSGTRIAVFDTGCAATNADLAGKTERGFDAHDVATKLLLGGGGFLGTLGDLGKGALGMGAAATPAGMVAGLGGVLGGPTPGVTELAGFIAGKAGKPANYDNNGHGTLVATTASGSWNNSLISCGVAPNSRIYPVKIAESDWDIAGPSAKTTDLELIAGMIHIMSTGIRIVNISYSAPYVGFANPKFHPALHKYFQTFVNQRSGLIFMSAGNTYVYDPTPRVSYLQIVSGIDRDGSLAHWRAEKGSTSGHFVSFTAPATGILCSDQNGQATNTPGNQPRNGTSFSCPMVAAVAALILDKKPALPNFEVLRTMIRSCKNVKGMPFNPLYGWGMPDAYIAAGLAAGKSMKELERPPAAQDGSSSGGAGAVARGGVPTPGSPGGAARAAGI